LIVEDDADLLQIIGALAASMDIEPVTASDGHAALSQFSAYQPDLCLVDILLPLANGFEVCRRIKNELGGSKVPVVMMSSVYRTIDQIRDDLVAYGADDFVAKPFTMVQLQELIRYYLPREGGIAEVPGASADSSQSKGHVRRVLVVEDDEDLNDVIAQAMRTMGHEVRQAHDGARALDIFAAMKPDICLVDILLPELNGLEVCRQIKAARGDKVKVLLMSALARNAQEAERDRRKYGADAYLAKPFAVSALRAAVDDLGRSLSVRVTSRGGREAISDTFPLTGAVAQHGIAKLLALIFVERRSGTLILRRDGTRKEIVFADGVPVAARSNAISEALGSLLIARGSADPSVINEVIAHRVSNRSLGEELLRRGVVQADVLNQTLGEQVRLRITNAFALDTGEFEFDPNADAAPSDRRFPQNPMELVREGLRRHRSMNTLASRLQTLVDRFPTRTLHFEALIKVFPLDEREARLVELIDGTRSLGDLLQRRVLGVTDALYLVWGLFEGQLVQFESRNAASATPTHATPTHATPGPRPLSSPGPTPAPSGLAAQVLRMEADLGTRDLGAWLGLPRDANAATILAALADRLRLLDPSSPAIQALPDAVRDKARRVHKVVSEQHKELDVPAAPAGPGKFKSGVTAEYRLSQGAIAHGVARAQMTRGEFALAVDTLDRAVQLNPDDPALLTDHAWCQYKLGQATADDARARLSRALTLDPRSAQTCYYTAMIAHETRHPEDALTWVGRCLNIHPDHREALALRASLMPGVPETSATAADDARSMWTKLFGD